MKKDLTELVFILDRSGSMGGLESDTIGGFNSMIEKQKNQKGEALVTTVLFDHQYQLIHDRTPIRQVRPLTGKEYYARGNTALLDAVGKTLDRMKALRKSLPEPERAEKTIFVITTDGLENASREYSYGKIKKMLEKQKKKHGWEFLFLGANMDAVSEAGKLGITADRSVTFKNDSLGIDLNYRAVSHALSKMRTAPCCAQVGSSWKSQVEEDYKKRGQA